MLCKTGVKRCPKNVLERSFCRCFAKPALSVVQRVCYIEASFRFFPTPALLSKSGAKCCPTNGLLRMFCRCVSKPALSVAHRMCDREVFVVGFSTLALRSASWKKCFQKSGAKLWTHNRWWDAFYKHVCFRSRKLTWRFARRKQQLVIKPGSTLWKQRAREMFPKGCVT